jgi:hypothetical protein
MSAMPAPPSVKSLKVCDDPTKASSMVFNADFNDAGIAAFSTIPPALIRPAHIFIFRHRCIPTRGQLREHQMRHAPADSSFPEVAGDQKFGFIRVARFFPDALPVWIAPAEHVRDRLESVDRVMHMAAWKAGREPVQPVAGL